MFPIRDVRVERFVDQCTQLGKKRSRIECLLYKQLDFESFELKFYGQKMCF